MGILEKFKKMDTNSNLYTFLYASGMVILVAVLLALAATSLKPFQQKNKETEKKIDILKSFGKADGIDKASNKHRFVDKLFSEFITEQMVVSTQGNSIQDVDAFDIDLKAELSKPAEERHLPIFKALLDDESVKYIIPVRGRGLWGPIWGYVALDDDLNTIYGTTFDHQGETPGLGAEINTLEFQKQFAGKTLFDNNSQFVSIRVVKGGAKDDDPHAVDAISGGTITSTGLQEMIFDCLENYQAFFNQQKNVGHE